MAYTYDVATSVGLVRLLVPDRVEADAFFSDEEITAMLTMEGDNVKRGTAGCLETLASSEAYVQKAIRVLDLTTNGPAVAAALMTRAARLRSEAEAEEAGDAGGAFDIAEWIVDDFSARERIWKEALR